MGVSRSGTLLAVSLVVLLVGSLVEVTCWTGLPSISRGHRQPGDKLLISDKLGLNGKKSQKICYPRPDKRRIHITAYNVTNRAQGGEGLAAVTQGGVGQGRLCLLLTSTQGRDFNFRVKIYGFYV